MVRLSSYASGQTDRQTNKQTNIGLLITILRTPLAGVEVIRVYWSLELEYLMISEPRKQNIGGAATVNENQSGVDQNTSEWRQIGYLTAQSRSTHMPRLQHSTEQHLH